MFTSMLSSRLTVIALALCAFGGVARAQQAGSPQLYLVDTGTSFELHVAAGTGHAGDAVFIVMTHSGSPEVAMAEGAVLDGRALDGNGQYRGPYTPPASLALTGRAAPPPSDPPHLMAVVMDGSGRLHGSAALPIPTGAPGSSLSLVTPAGPVTPAPPPCLIVPACTAGQLPDLIISGIVLNTATTSTGCTGAPLPFVGCPNGRNFTITATITNIGTCGIPCNTPISIKWGKGLTAGTIVFEFSNQTVPSPGLAAGASMTITRSYYMGSCDTVPPQTFHLDFFSAIVDPTNTIAELNETNNTATAVPACNFE